MKISKRGEPEKKIWGEGNQKGGKIFKNKGGNPTFEAEFRYRKEQK